MQAEEKPNRAELIRQAREECSRHIAWNSTGTERRTLNENSYHGTETTRVERSELAAKFMMIRVIAAILIFLCFVTATELNLSYQQLNSTEFTKQMQSDIIIEKAEECISVVSQSKFVKAIAESWNGK